MGNMRLAIYGAQGYALGVYKAMKALYPKREVLCFLVSSMGGNALTLGGIPVRELKSFSAGLDAGEKRKIGVLIATPESQQAEIEELLENHGFPRHRRLDSGYWGELMKLFHIKLGRFLPLAALPVGYHKPFLRVYVARSHKDLPLQQGASLPGYMFPLQVGAGRSGVRVAGLQDNAGQNISGKNGNYSELTGLYWIWKNKLSGDYVAGSGSGQYFGLMQYRRMLAFSEDDLLRLSDNDVDAVLPYPLPYEPDINAHHQRYLKGADWDALRTALRELHPEYAGAFPELLSQQYFYNYNVLLARKDVLRDYCEWLFPILERVEELSVPKGGERADRYLGYMAESLETLYFMKNTGKLNLVHTGCRMLV